MNNEIVETKKIYLLESRKTDVKKINIITKLGNIFHLYF